MEGTQAVVASDRTLASTLQIQDSYMGRSSCRLSLMNSIAVARPTHPCHYRGPRAHRGGPTPLAHMAVVSDLELHAPRSRGPSPCRRVRWRPRHQRTSGSTRSASEQNSLLDSPGPPEIGDKSEVRFRPVCSSLGNQCQDRHTEPRDQVGPSSWQDLSSTTSPASSPQENSPFADTMGTEDRAVVRRSPAARGRPCRPMTGMAREIAFSGSASRALPVATRPNTCTVPTIGSLECRCSHPSHQSHRKFPGAPRRC